MESDGSLLDGASLANEWSLPVLPEDNSSHPSSSQEMADIFGTSDDEEVVDFPFGLSSDLPVPKGFEDITLPGGNGNSLLSNADSELFLAGFRPSDSREATKASPQKEEVQKEREIEPQDEKMETVEKQNDNKKDIEPVSDHTESTEEPAAATEESTETPPSKEAEALVRKSARLRARVGDTESCSEPEHVEPSKQPPRPETPPPPPVKEEPPILEPKGEEGKMEDVVVEKKKDSSPTVSSSDESGSDDDSEGEDPNKLYCICRQPHDDRFMICCDVCEDWFHGNCVGITVGQGKKMEREGREYVCPVCLQRQHMTKEEAAASRSARQLQREVARDKVIKKKLAAQGLTEPHAKRRRTLSGSTPTDGYGMSQLFLPDNAPRGGDVSSTSEQEDVKPNANDLLYYDCVISSCPNKSLPPSIYCSSECIEKHVSSSLRRLASRGIKVSTNASEFVKGSGGVGVVEKATNKILMGMCAPSERELVPWLQSHPSYQVLIPDKGKKSKLKSTRVKVKAEAKTEEIKYPTLMDPDSVRANAKKALYQILWKRHGDAADMSSVTQSAVEAIAHDIEEKLFNLNQDINPKYKNKYRSLIFNLKDSKNQGLFRKVLTKEIGSRELVRMSSEKLASKELAAWRESTLKKDLEMIKQREEEAGALGEVIRKVTHKGEIEIDSSEIGDKVIMENSSITDSPKPAHVESTKLDSKHLKSKKQSSDSKSPDNKGTSGGGILALLQSTTSEHGQHLYDHHCDICTGKMKPPTLSTSPPPSPDSRMHEDAHTTEHTSPDSVVKPLSPVPQYDPHKVLWRGPVSMVGLSQFSSTAYPVSGHTDYIAEHLPKAMHVMGRIAYAQVWDYLDKIRSSGSKEICVIHFGWPEEEQDAYVSMFNYLLRKHRSGVIISSGPDAIKDMYLVPLPGHWDVPEQLLPITGPGLPVGRSDMMLGVIVHSKSRRMSLHSNHSSPVTRIKAEVTFKRHRSSSNDTEGLQRKKNKVEIGFGDRTPPPISSKHRAETKREPIKNEDDDSTPYSPSKMYEDSSFDDALSSKPAVEVKKEKPKTVQMSFYGEHQPASSKSTVTVPSPVKAIPVVNSPKSVATSSEDTTNKLIDINTTAVAASLKSALNLPPTANIQTLLANLSSSKLKELASAVSTLEKISDGPIDQSTLAAAGTGKLRAVFSSDGPSNSSPPVPSVPASGPSEPPPHRQSLQQVTPLDQPTHPYQPQESQFRTEWDQRHQRPTFRPEPPPPPQQQQQQQQYHPQDTPYQQPTPNQPPPPNHGPMNDLPQPPSNDPSYPPPPSNDPSYPPPPNNDPSYPPPQHNDPSSYHPPQAEQHSWRDPRTNWGQQQQYQHEHQQPQDDGWNRDERFNNSGRGYRGGYRGRGERRGTWDKDHRSEHGDRYRGYHT